MQPVERIERLFHEKIPLTRAMGVKVASYDGDTLTLVAPLEPNRNHLYTAFGGSLHALATLSCYGWLWLELENDSAHIVVRESTVSYRHPIHGELRAICRRPSSEAVELFKSNFAARKKARLELEATIEEDGKVAVRYVGEFVAFA
ncbi:YiiD C-terminal domain-containing protein [Verrucomicrobiota bacterium sgz303538]